jgi:hypothetical protein
MRRIQVRAHLLRAEYIVDMYITTPSSLKPVREYDS